MAKIPILTDDEAVVKLLEIKERCGRDREWVHIDADKFLLELLLSLGYPQTTEVFRLIPKCYS